jgi:hypothetical protein
LGGAASVISQPWVTATNYSQDIYVTYNGSLYVCLVDNTSSASFTNDLTAGYWALADSYSGSSSFGASADGLDYPWTYRYQLPSDFILLIELNGNNLDNDHTGDLYEVYGDGFYCDVNPANIKYVALDDDTTKWDSLFIDCVSTLLASNMATLLRKDDLNVAVTMRNLYTNDYLPKARIKDGGQRKPRRFSHMVESRFVGSRYNSTNS